MIIRLSLILITMIDIFYWIGGAFFKLLKIIGFLILIGVIGGVIALCGWRSILVFFAIAGVIEIIKGDDY